MSSQSSYSKLEKLDLLIGFEDEQLRKIRKKSKLNKKEDQVEKKNKDLWDNEDYVDHLRKSALTLHILYCTIPVEIFYRVATCKTPKEVWDGLNAAYGHSHEDLNVLLRKISPRESPPSQESDSIQDAPILSDDGRHFSYWKARMRAFVESNDPQFWYIIEHGPLKITKPGKKGARVEKHEGEYNKNDYIKHSKNERAKKLLLSGLTENMAKLLSSRNSAKEMWTVLNDLYEGDDQTKQLNISSLEGEYESFSLAKGEPIKDMFDRFYAIVGQLGLLGEEVTMRAQVRKILRSLPKEYEILVTKINCSDFLADLTLNDVYPLILAREEQIKILR